MSQQQPLAKMTKKEVKLRIRKNQSKETPLKRKMAKKFKLSRKVQSAAILIKGKFSLFENLIIFFTGLI